MLSDSSFLSYSASGQFDSMAFSFVGPETTIGKGVIINAKFHMHHECILGDFIDIGPCAMLLGSSQAGKCCRISASAVLLPGSKIGDNVIVGTGAVVTKNFDSELKIVGVPAKSLSISF